MNKRKLFLLALVVPAFSVIILFNIIPGITYLPAVFKNWTPPQSLWDAKWVGLDWFKKILNYYNLPELIRNSVVLGLWDIALLPIPLILAIACQYCGSPRMKKMIDILSMIPVFIPTVIVVAVTQKILSYEGLLNQVMSLFGIAAENHLLNGQLFYVYFSISVLWSGMGFSCLVYRACLTVSNSELHEAAKMDGASLLKRIWYIDLPLCRSAFLVNLIFQIGGILNTNTERLLLFKNTANSNFSTTLDLYAYELTFKSTMMPAYSKAMALSIMMMIVNLLLLLSARRVAAKVEDIYV